MDENQMQDLMDLLSETGLPFAYDHFAEGESPEPPFITFLIPEWFRTDILQEEKDSNGVLIERSDITESVYFALLFEFDGDQKAIRHVMYNCTASRPTIESQTKESSIEPGTETLSIAADPREDGLVKSRTGDDTSTATYNNWYKSVYVPSAAAASSGSSTSGS